MKAVRDALAAMTAYPTAILRAIIAGDAPRERHRAVPRDPEFMQRITLGLTTMSSDGRMIAVQVNGYAGMLTVVCAAWRQAKTLIMTTVEDRVDHVIAGIGAMARESLFLVYEGRRYPVKREPFVIGRSKVCDLRIRDGCVSRRHAAVMYKNGRYYIVDLESQAGIEYRGMKIRNKRIEEGDMFKLHEYALRFTFHETDA
ncbi:MAG TPA: FHA domain-containing protein [Kofleriaceae bacterium]|nr:FHA domain-containing protein [Kofleriaceae bacterium]